MNQTSIGRVLHVGLRGIAPAAARRGERPVVFLHAFPLDSRMWGPLADELAERGVTAHGFDYPGCGTTPAWPDVEPSLDAIADAAVATLRDGIGATAAHWVGCSMGGYVALAILDRHPDAVAGLGLVGTRSVVDSAAGLARRLEIAADLDGRVALPDPRAMAEPLVGTVGGGREALVSWVEGVIAPQPPAVVAWSQRAMAARPDRTAMLQSFGGPAVVAWGDRDAVMSIDDSQHMADALSVSVTVVPGVGHLAPLEAPRAVADALSPLFAGE